MYAKTIIKDYKNGDKQYRVYKTPLLLETGERRRNVSRSVTPKTNEELEKERKHTEYQNLRRAKVNIIDYCLANEFDMFWTLTFNTERDVDERCLDRFGDWIKRMKKKHSQLSYVFVPEKHKDGCIHFHGVTYGFNGDLVEYKKHKGNTIYTCQNWKFGFSQVEPIRDIKKISSYLVKNLSQETVGKGRKKYWCSRGLKRPTIEYFDYNPMKGLKPDWENENMQIYNTNDKSQSMKNVP